MLHNIRKSANLILLANSSIFLALAIVFAIAATLGSSALAQSATTGAIGGTITDSGGALLPATSVTVKSADTGLARTVKSNSSGEYSVQELEPGTYSATFVADGFEELVDPDRSIDC